MVGSEDILDPHQSDLRAASGSGPNFPQVDLAQQNMYRANPHVFREWSFRSADARSRLPQKPDLPNDNLAGGLERNLGLVLNRLSRRH